MSIKFAVFQLVKDYEKKIGHDVNLSQLAPRVGVDYRTLSSAMRGDMQRVDLTVMEKILTFFTNEGMPITIDQLFTVQEEGSQAENLDG